MEKFNYEPNGYNRQEVNNFISDVIDQTSGIVKKYTEQKEKIKKQDEQIKEQNEEILKLKNELAHYRQIENNLKDSIIRADDTASQIKYLAKQDADLIIKDAKNNASRIVNEALIKSQKIDSRTEIALKNFKVFKRKINIIVEEQKAILDELNDIEVI